MLRYFIFIEYGLLPDLRVGVLISASQREREAFRKDISKRGYFVCETDKYGNTWNKVNPSVAARQGTTVKMAAQLIKLGLNNPCADDDEEM